MCALVPSVDTVRRHPQTVASVRPCTGLSDIGHGNGMGSREGGGGTFPRFFSGIRSSNVSKVKSAQEPRLLGDDVRRLRAPIDGLSISSTGGGFTLPLYFWRGAVRHVWPSGRIPFFSERNHRLVGTFNRRDFWFKIIYCTQSFGIVLRIFLSVPGTVNRSRPFRTRLGCASTNSFASSGRGAPG